MWPSGILQGTEWRAWYAPMSATLRPGAHSRASRRGGRGQPPS